MIERGVVMTELENVFQACGVHGFRWGAQRLFRDDRAFAQGRRGQKVMTWAKPDSPYAKAHDSLKKRSTWTATKKPTRP